MKKKQTIQVLWPENIILIGMFGSGKSTIGRELAELLRYHFVDVDHLIENRFKKPLQKVLNELGMKEFMRMESLTLQHLHPRHCVVAPGGSAVYYAKAMRGLGKVGLRVHIQVPLGELKKRLPNWSNRGVVCLGGETLPALFRERLPLLKRYADVVVNCPGRSTERNTKRVLKAIQAYMSKRPTHK